MVGYGKLPRRSRFQLGHSGNLQDRAKDLKNLAILLEEALNEAVVVNENGRRKRISMREAVLKQLVTGRPPAIPARSNCY